jgi:hypothetical protein
MTVAAKPTEKGKELKFPLCNPINSHWQAQNATERGPGRDTFRGADGDRGMGSNELGKPRLSADLGPERIMSRLVQLQQKPSGVNV